MKNGRLKDLVNQVYNKEIKFVYKICSLSSFSNPVSIPYLPTLFSFVTFLRKTSSNSVQTPLSIIIYQNEALVFASVVHYKQNVCIDFHSSCTYRNRNLYKVVYGKTSQYYHHQEINHQVLKLNRTRK